MKFNPNIIEGAAMIIDPDSFLMENVNGKREAREKAQAVMDLKNRAEKLDRNPSHEDVMKLLAEVIG